MKYLQSEYGALIAVELSEGSTNLYYPSVPLQVLFRFTYSLFNR
jgi:hypothetical protein